MVAYLDLNVFDRIEKKDQLSEAENQIYSGIERLIIEQKIIVPYSNAHLNDLFRGYQKNPRFIEGHLNNLHRLTNNLCTCLYWGEKEVSWHYRDIKEFFNEKKKEWEYEPNSFHELISDVPEFQLIIEIHRNIPLHSNWKLGYKQDPMFGIMFPKSKNENNLAALVEDVYNFQSRLKSDFGLYRTFKAYLIRSMKAINQNREMLKAIKANNPDLPEHLGMFDFIELCKPQTQKQGNEFYSKVIETFFKYDLKGYKSDKNYNNMFDDALHTFYGAHCDFFITNDERCRFKANKTYERLNINTNVITAEDYVSIINI